MGPENTELRKFVAPEFVYGVGALALAGHYAASFSARKVLVVTDPGVAKAGWTDGVIRSLEAEGIAWEVFDGLTPNPKEREVDVGARRYADAGCDVIVAVGGGSPMDCAKSIGICSANEMGVLEFEGVDEVPVPGPPLICVPTTAGTSADVSQFAIISDTARKLKIAIISKTVVPDVALIDPETTTTMSPELTAATGMDALVHAVEAYVSNASSFVTDLNSLAAVPLVAGHLAPAVADPLNMESRDAMMRASLLAGLAFSNASLGLTHAMSHSLGGLLDSPHGICNALILESVVEFNYSTTSDRYDAIATAMGVDLTGLDRGQRRQALVDAIVRLREAAGIAGGLDARGVSAAEIPQLAANAHKDPCLATNPRPATIEEIEELYERSL
jgi:alcohol dehydrogenase class IV